MERNTRFLDLGSCDLSFAITYRNAMRRWRVAHPIFAPRPNHPSECLPSPPLGRVGYTKRRPVLPIPRRSTAQTRKTLEDIC